MQRERFRYNERMTTKQPLPKGKITIRFIASRCVDQIYIGGKYVIGASGSGERGDDAIENLCEYYNVPALTKIERVGSKHKEVFFTA